MPEPTPEMVGERNARGLCASCNRPWVAEVTLQVIEGIVIRYGSCIPCTVRVQLMERDAEESA